ncbi:DUF4238 domain-containing protein [Methyloversatilis sp. RAC08]|uniref:DUF4238 domain-containing protein n=1 Tax=Methyloversatilis sp. RAC08 TaxID=1842540 RepID=UPI0009F3848C|nr:DUF4238 domain-containing protein [Methyloversatilis sp. RAC08]
MSPVDFCVRNHYVPEHYLKRWAAGTPKVWTYRLLVPHANVRSWKQHSIETIAKREHLYTRLRDGRDSDEMERWFSIDFESPANVVIEKILVGRAVSPTEWRRLARFVALQDVRTPARMTEIVNRAAEYLPSMLEEVLEGAVKDLAMMPENRPALRIGEDSESVSIPISMRTEFKPGARTGKLILETIAGRAYWLYAIEMLLTKTVKCLEEHRWTVVRPPDGMKWLTSDNPVVKLNYYGDETFDLGGGWGRDGSEIFLPLSPDCLLYTHVGRKPAFRRGEKLPNNIAVKIQCLIIKNAHRYIFSEDMDPDMCMLRPSVVDREIVRSEQKSWAEFHISQTTAELDLYAKGLKTKKTGEVAG